MYELITQKEADRIKSILSKSSLKENIYIEAFNGKYIINVSGISDCHKTKNNGYDMKEFYLTNNSNSEDVFKTFKYIDKSHEIFIDFGEWGYSTRLNKAHITVGASFHSYLFQLELSQAIKDNEYLYIVKNVTNLSGKGALVRLYRHLGKNREQKEYRKKIFIEKFNSEVLNYTDKSWIVISKIKLDDLFDSDKQDNIYYELLSGILKAMILVEGIGEEL